MLNGPRPLTVGWACRQLVARLLLLCFAIVPLYTALCGLREGLPGKGQWAGLALLILEVMHCCLGLLVVATMLLVKSNHITGDLPGSTPSSSPCRSLADSTLVPLAPISSSHMPVWPDGNDSVRLAWHAADPKGHIRDQGCKHTLTINEQLGSGSSRGPGSQRSSYTSDSRSRLSSSSWLDTMATAGSQQLDKEHGKAGEAGAAQQKVTAQGQAARLTPEQPPSRSAPESGLGATPGFRPSSESVHGGAEGQEGSWLLAWLQPRTLHWLLLLTALASLALRSVATLALMPPPHSPPSRWPGSSPLANSCDHQHYAAAAPRAGSMAAAVAAASSSTLSPPGLAHPAPSPPGVLAVGAGAAGPSHPHSTSAVSRAPGAGPDAEFAARLAVAEAAAAAVGMCLCACTTAHSSAAPAVTRPLLDPSLAALHASTSAAASSLLPNQQDHPLLAAHERPAPAPPDVLPAPAPEPSPAAGPGPGAGGAAGEGESECEGGAAGRGGQPCAAAGAGVLRPAGPGSWVESLLVRASVPLAPLLAHGLPAWLGHLAPQFRLEFALQGLALVLQQESVGCLMPQLMLMAVCHVPLHVASVLLSPSPLAALHVDVAQLAVNTLLAIMVLLLLHTGLNSLLPAGLPQAGCTEGQEGWVRQARGMQGPPSPPSPLLTPPNTPPGTPPSAPVWWLGRGCAAMACMPAAGMAVQAQGVTAPQFAAHGHTSRSCCRAPEGVGHCTDQQQPGACEGPGTSPALQVSPEVWQPCSSSQIKVGGSTAAAPGECPGAMPVSIAPEVWHWLQQLPPGQERLLEQVLLEQLQQELLAVQQRWGMSGSLQSSTAAPAIDTGTAVESIHHHAARSSQDSCLTLLPQPTLSPAAAQPAPIQPMHPTPHGAQLTGLSPPCAPGAWGPPYPPPAPSPWPAPPPAALLPPAWPRQLSAVSEGSEEAAAVSCSLDSLCVDNLCGEADGAIGANQAGVGEGEGLAPNAPPSTLLGGGEGEREGEGACAPRWGPGLDPTTGPRPGAGAWPWAAAEIRVRAGSCCPPAGLSGAQQRAAGGTAGGPGGAGPGGVSGGVSGAPLRRPGWRGLWEHVSQPHVAYYVSLSLSLSCPAPPCLQVLIHVLGLELVVCYLLDSHQLRSQGFISWTQFWPSLLLPCVNGTVLVLRLLSALTDNPLWRNNTLNGAAIWYCAISLRLLIILLQPYEPRPYGVWRCFTFFLLLATATSRNARELAWRAAFASMLYSLAHAWAFAAVSPHHRVLSPNLLSPSHQPTLDPYGLHAHLAQPPHSTPSCAPSPAPALAQDLATSLARALAQQLNSTQGSQGVGGPAAAAELAMGFAARVMSAAASAAGIISQAVQQLPEYALTSAATCVAFILLPASLRMGGGCVEGP
ncbi:hypothetical protein QJQ45_022942 [Haematococcus lacustris]|nr:hypothetical protein QJQ45_022942 [Haematococcus lacustris]